MQERLLLEQLTKGEMMLPGRLLKRSRERQTFTLRTRSRTRDVRLWGERGGDVFLQGKCH